MEGGGRAAVIDAGKLVMPSFWVILVSFIDMTIFSSVWEEMGFARPRLEEKLSTEDLPDDKLLMCTGVE